MPQLGMAAAELAKIALELPPEEREGSGADVNDLLGGRDLRAQGGLLDGGRRHARGQCQVRNFELKALGLRQAHERLDLPPVAAEDVRREAECALRLVERERRGRSVAA